MTPFRFEHAPEAAKIMSWKSMDDFSRRPNMGDVAGSQEGYVKLPRNASPVWGIRLFRYENCATRDTGARWKREKVGARKKHICVGNCFGCEKKGLWDNLGRKGVHHRAGGKKKEVARMGRVVIAWLVAASTQLRRGTAFPSKR